MLTLVEHIEKAFPQDQLPPEAEIEAFIREHESPEEAVLIRDSLVLPFDRRALSFADPSFLFWARGRLRQFMLGTYLLTVYENEVRQVGFHDREDFLQCLLIVLWVSGPTWPYLNRPEHLDLQFVETFGDYTVYQCCVIAECVRYCADHLTYEDQWHSQKALDIYWGVFPPLSEWPDAWSQ